MKATKQLKCQYRVMLSRIFNLHAFEYEKWCCSLQKNLLFKFLLHFFKEKELVKIHSFRQRQSVSHFHF